MGSVLQSRFSALIKRVLVLKAVDPGANVGGGIVPGIEVNDPQFQPENRALRGERLWGGGQDMGVQLTSFPLVTIGNPVPGSGGNRLIILKRLRISSILPTSTNQPGTVYFVIYRHFTNTSGIAAPFFNVTDSREQQVQGIQASPVCFNTGNNSNVAIVASTEYPKALLWWSPGALAGTTTNLDKTFDDLQIVITPGWELRFGFAATSLPVSTWGWSFTAEGHERLIDPSELTVPP